jgi:hypothetical protein
MLTIWLGWTLQRKGVRDKEGYFSFRVKKGECEVEISGTREEVLEAVENLQSLVLNVQKAFESLKPKAVATLTVKTEAAKEAPAQKYPKIVAAENCEENVLRVLKTDWGKWRPRTIGELKEALKVNGLSYSGRVFAGVLLGLVKKGSVRRWKTNAGYVYILAEKEVLG